LHWSRRETIEAVLGALRHLGICSNIT